MDAQGVTVDDNIARAPHPWASGLLWPTTAQQLHTALQKRNWDSMNENPNQLDLLPASHQNQAQTGNEVPLWGRLLLAVSVCGLSLDS